MKRVDKLKEEIRRLEAEESAANAGDRLSSFVKSVNKTGYFRFWNDFYRVAPKTSAWLNNDKGLFNVDVSESVSLLCGTPGHVTIETDGADVFSCYEPEHAHPILKEDYEAAKSLLASVRAQVMKFKEKFKDEHGD